MITKVVERKVLTLSLLKSSTAIEESLNKKRSAATEFSQLFW